ncbi:adhesion exoprotein [Limosilactobacillus coleohominis DSM 14060]|nr:adhesion exoprotein [Limosilactobacillus coleohominis DSM 14060]
MVSKNNQWQKRQREMQTVQHFGIRKLTVGVSSVLLGLSFMGMAVTNVKADTVSGSQTTNVAAGQATDSAKEANDPVPVNDEQKSTDQKSAAPVATQTQTVQVKDLKKAAAAVPADSLKESKAVSTEPEAKEVDLQIRRDSGDKTNDWYPSKSDLYNGSWNRFGVEGSFVIPKDEIKGGNEIKLLTLGQTSDTGWLSSIYFEWLPDVIVDGKKIGTLTASTQQNGYQQMSSATLYIKLVDDVSSFAGSDQFIRLNVSHAGVFGFREDLLPLGKTPNKKSVNTYTIMNGA